MIWLFQFFKELAYSGFWNAWAVSLMKSGYTLSSASNMMAIFFLVSSFLELPTGMLADIYGKKKITGAGILFTGLGFAALALGSNYSYGIIGFSMIGLGFTCVSGACTSWLISLPYIHGRESLLFNLDILGRIANVVGTFLSILLLKTNPSWMWASLSVAAIISSLFMINMPSDFKLGDSVKTKTVLLKIHFKKISTPIYLIFASSLFFGIESGVRNLVAQPYILELKVDEYFLAYFGMTLSVSRLLGILFYKKFLKRFNKMVEFSVVSLLLFSVAEFVAYKTTNYLIFVSFYSLAIFAIGWYFPIRDIYINSLLEDETRATMLSFDSFVNKLFSAVVCFGIGFANSNMSLNKYWLIGACSLILTGMFLHFSYTAHKKENSTNY